MICLLSNNDGTMHSSTKLNIMGCRTLPHKAVTRKKYKKPQGDHNFSNLSQQKRLKAFALHHFQPFIDC